RIEEAAEDGLGGWTPARYLLILQIEDNAATAMIDPSAGEDTAPQVDETGQAEDAEKTEPALPPGLEARFGGEPMTPPDKDEADIAAIRELASRLRPADSPAREPETQPEQATGSPVPVP